jgi:hypothetical protein
MKFAAKKDKSIKSLLLIIGVLCIATITIMVLNANGQVFTLLASLIVLTLVGMVVWIWFDTSYYLTENKLHYKSGPFRGSLNIDKIVRITKNQTLLAGMKPALARNGLTIRFNKWDEIYIAPVEPELLISELLRVNPEIKIEEQ